MGVGVWGLGFGVWGLGFGVWDLRSRAWGARSRVYGLRFEGSRSRVPWLRESWLLGVGFRVIIRWVSGFRFRTSGFGGRI